MSLGSGLLSRLSSREAPKAEIHRRVAVLHLSSAGVVLYRDQYVAMARD